MARFLNVKAIKTYVKAGGKRTGKSFINRLDDHVLVLLQRAIKEHNGGKKTLDTEIAAYIGVKI